METNLTEEYWILINAQPFEDRLQPSDGRGWPPYLADLKITYPSPEEVEDFSAWFSSVNVDYIYLGNQGDVYGLEVLEENYTFTPVFERNDVILYQVFTKQ